MIEHMNSFNSEEACIMDPLNRIDERYSANVWLHKKTISRMPDASLALLDDNFPILILETAYSQRGEDLKEIAHQYLMGSDGNIRLVIGCNIEYELRSRKATVSLWQPDFMINPTNATRTILKSIQILDNDVMLSPMSITSINSSDWSFALFLGFSGPRWKSYSKPYFTNTASPFNRNRWSESGSFEHARHRGDCNPLRNPLQHVELRRKRKSNTSKSNWQSSSSSAKLWQGGMEFFPPPKNCPLEKRGSLRC